MAVAALFGGHSRSATAAPTSCRSSERAEDEARRQIDEERLRIARELHDVVAHAMSTINGQASAAALVLHRPPGRGRRGAGQAIRTASKNGLRELRAILNVLQPG